MKPILSVLAALALAAGLALVSATPAEARKDTQWGGKVHAKDTQWGG